MDERLERIEKKLDVILHRLDAQPDQRKYVPARGVAEMTGLDHRTILSRSNLDPSDPRYIPSVRFGSRRKYFERRVIERLFRPA